ncbi:MAG: helix-turn-helix domain-containing protein [Actinomycetales bacterium]|nr:helix-turn-helix domain-containing protein [Actinomycetales bacterium]
MSPEQNEHRPEQHRAASPSAAGRQVLDELHAANAPLDAAAVAERLGVHVTTARFHLDRLADAGLAHRRTGSEPRRGRPRILYTPAGPERDEESREQLIHVLASALAADDTASTESVDAGRRWADSFDPLTDTDPAAGLVDVLDRLGFDPDPHEQQIRLRACPFRDAAREHPQVVCAVHRGLIEQLLEPSGTRSRLVPFAEPDLCLVTLEPALAASR